MAIKSNVGVAGSVAKVMVDVSLGVVIWRTGSYPCSKSPLSTSLMDPKEQHGHYSLAPAPPQDLPEGSCKQRRTALGTPTPGFSSTFTPEAFSMTAAKHYNYIKGCSYTE